MSPGSTGDAKEADNRTWNHRILRSEPQVHVAAFFFTRRNALQQLLLIHQRRINKESSKNLQMLYMFGKD